MEDVSRSEERLQNRKLSSLPSFSPSVLPGLPSLLTVVCLVPDRPSGGVPDQTKRGGGAQPCTTTQSG